MLRMRSWAPRKPDADNIALRQQGREAPPYVKPSAGAAPGGDFVHANHTRVREGIIVFGVSCMKPGDARMVIDRVRAELGSPSRRG
jgi:hypothetical protein